MATRWRWPPESWSGRRSSRWVICRSSAAWLTRFSISGLGVFAIFRPNDMFSRTLMRG